MKKLHEGEVERGGLKVLWIEDERDKVNLSALLACMRGAFDLVVAAAPDDVAEELSQQRPSVAIAEEDSRYSLKGFPFDVYLADWDLTKAGKPVGGGKRSSAMNAGAAGLATSVLAATQFPQHPAAVVPYSARWSELEPHAELFELMTPGAIYVEWKKGKQLKREQIPSSIDLLSAAFREALLLAAEGGVVYFLRKNLGALKRALASESELEEWLENGTVPCRTRWGLRVFRGKALWFEFARKLKDIEPERRKKMLKSLVEDMSAWLERLPAFSAVELACWDIAREYFFISKTDHSAKRYELSRLIAVGPERTEAESAAINALLGEMGLDSVAVRDAAFSAEAPPEWQYPYVGARELTDLSQTHRMRRLVVLMILVQETWFRRTVATGADYGNLMSGIQSELRQLATAAQVAEDSATLELLRRAMEFRLAEAEELALRYTQPISTTDVPQLIDPLPSKLSAYGIDRGGKLGRMLQRLDPPLDVVALLQGKRPLQLLRGLCEDWVQAESRTPAMQKARQSGARYGRGPVFGYRRADQTGEVTLKVKEGEAQQIRALFREFLGTHSLKKTAEIVSEEFSDGPDALWKRDSVASRLIEPLYAGYIQWGGAVYTLDHEAIVDEESFNSVQWLLGYPLKEEKACLRGFARDLGLEREGWPWWLKEGK